MTLTPKGQIDRTGTVNFGDASLNVWEEGIREARSAGGYAGEKAWERQFKRRVFARIVQTLNRLGWTCVVPEEYVKQYGLSFARDRRECHKGDLKGWLDLSGRTIKFEMWQGVNTPTRPDHGGRYEHNKEGCMPYVLRLEMERTRRRIRDYLCNVFAGYVFEEKSRSTFRKPLEQTALEQIQDHYAESWHFKGDMADYLKRNGYERLPSYNAMSRDGVMIEHGQRVWFYDEYTGRMKTGTAYYNINNMWWVVTGKYDYTNIHNGAIYTSCPGDPRVKNNDRIRRKRLEDELANAIKAMNFKRAETLKNILFPTNEPLYLILNKKERIYFAPNYCGYRSSPIDAGKYTRAELKPYFPGGVLETDELRAVLVEAA